MAKPRARTITVKPRLPDTRYSKGITNATRGEGYVYLGGKQRRIRFEMEQMCQLEEALNDQSVITLIQQKRFNFRVISEALTVGLRVFNASVTPQQVRIWLKEEMVEEETLPNFTKIVTTLQTAIMCSVSGSKAHREIQQSVDSGEFDRTLDEIGAQEDELPAQDDDEAEQKEAPQDGPLAPSSRTANG